MSHRLPRALGAATLCGAFLFASFASCGPSGGGFLPEPDTCEMPQTRAPIDSLELGAGTDGAFRPLADGDVVTLARGGQGNLMLPLRLRVGGSAVPTCLEQKSEVLGASGSGSGTLQTVASLDTPLATYAEGAARTTRVVYLVIFGAAPSGQPLVVRAEAGGKVVERALWVGHVGDGGLPRSDGGATNADGGR